MTRNGDYVPAVRAETEFALMELAESDEHKPAVEQREQYMNEIVEVEMYQVDRKYVPKRNLRLSQKRLLDFFVIGEFEDDVPEVVEEKSDEPPVEAVPDAPKKKAVG